MKVWKLDARGHKVLPLFEMARMYESDPSSLFVLYNYPSHKYIVIPDLWISVYPNSDLYVTVTRKYPVELEFKTVSLSPRALDSLRRLYKTRASPWIVEDGKACTRFNLPGRLIVAQYPRIRAVPLPGMGL